MLNSFACPFEVIGVLTDAWGTPPLINTLVNVLIIDADVVVIGALTDTLNIVVPGRSCDALTAMTTDLEFVLPMSLEGPM